jgi:uncharacterized repeat protein (TIGR03803 family)
MPTAVRAQVVYTTMTSFNTASGLEPEAALIQGIDGNFYGTTHGGNGSCFSPGRCGSVFKVTPAGVLTTLWSFCSKSYCADGDAPMGSLMQTANGNIYGVTEYGGGGSPYCQACGTIFKITPEGYLTRFYSFCALLNCADGAVPTGGLIQGSNGNFYGTTSAGGANFGGTVFQITPSRKLTTLYTFCSLPNCPDGSQPTGSLVQAPNGNFYGETSFGGASGGGTIFEITPGGKLTTLFDFNGPDDFFPLGGLMQAANGDLYGVTEAVGTNIGGTIFKITSADQISFVYTFCGSTSFGHLPYCPFGVSPNGPLAQGNDGNFYGTTFEGGLRGCSNNTSCGTIFEMTPEGVLTTVYKLNRSTGTYPFAGLLQATNGIFYGTTSDGGFGYGTIFSLSTGLAPFVKTQPASANEGVNVGIFGQGFDSSSAVQFGGVPATNVIVTGTTFLTAKVPAGALTGSVTVTTGATTLTSNQPFQVTPRILSFDPPSGSVGTQVTITGTGFTQTNGVGFGDNVPAEFMVNSDTQLTATVPAGAKTGPVGVVTKGGTAVSAAIFTVN